jgi:uncharacterized protein (DUF736 family)
MVKEYDNNLTGALFKNDKGGNEKRPEYRGQCEIDGAKYWISAWIRKSKKGDTFMSLRFEEQETERESSRSTSRPQSSKEEFDDDIPF